MITVNIEPNTITPFVESNQLINFKIESNYYVKNSKLYNPRLAGKKALQITSRITQINPIAEDTYSYHFSLKLSPELNEISSPNLKSFSNFREQENFHQYVSNFKTPIVFEWEERIFKDTSDVFTSIDNQSFLNEDNAWDEVYKNNYTIIKKLMSNTYGKKSSICNLKNPSIRGLNDDLKIKLPRQYFENLFNDTITGYSSPTIYNSKIGIWESTSVLKILNNYWEKILLNLNDQERYSFIAKVLYPIMSNSNLNNFYFGGYLEPFKIRDILFFKSKTKDILTGLKMDLANSNTQIAKNVVKEYVDYTQVEAVTTTVLNANVFHEISNSFTNQEDVNIYHKPFIKQYSYKIAQRNFETKTPFDLNGRRTKKKNIVLTNLENPYPLYFENSMNLNYSNSAIEETPLQPFDEDKKTAKKYSERYENNNVSFYDNITNEVKENIITNLSNQLFNQKNILIGEDKIQYLACGNDIDKSVNSIGRDSITYIGLKE